jgi:hypothetical protein
MSKRKPAKASKRAPSPKIAARAQRNKQDIVRSAKDELLRSVAAGPIESPLELHDDSKQNAPIVEKHEASSVEKQKAPIAENRVAVLQDHFERLTKSRRLAVARSVRGIPIRNIVELTQLRFQTLLLGEQHEEQTASTGAVQFLDRHCFPLNSHNAPLRQGHHCIGSI